MNVLDRLRVIYELDDARFQAGINRMRSAGNRFASDAVGFGRRTEGAFSRIGGSAVAAAASIASLGVALNKLRTASDGFKTITNQLRSIGEESDAAVDKLLAVAIRSRAPVEDLATSVARIQKATGDGYDITLRRAETLNKLLSVGGSTAAEVSSVVTQLSQALSAGVLQGDEFASLREAAPVELLDALAAAAGTSRDQLKYLSEEGQLTSEIMTKALDSLAESADRNFARTAETTGQAFTNINSALEVFIGRADQGAGASNVLIDAMNDLSGWLVDNASEAEALGQSLGAMFDVGRDAVSDFLRELDGIADGIRDAFGVQPLDDFGDGIDRVVGFVADLNGAIEGAAAVAEAAFQAIADTIASGLTTAINAVASAVETMINSILAGVRAVAGAIDTITAGAASVNNMLPERLREGLGLRTEGTNLAGSIQDVKIGRVDPALSGSSGKPLSEVYAEAQEAGVARVVDAIDASNQAYGGNLARRQIASQTPLQLGLPPVVEVDDDGEVAVTPAGGSPSSKKGGKGRKGGSGSKKKKADSPFFEDVEKDIVNLERQISLVGKSNEEVATAKARWELLDEAKKRGIPVNAELNAQIDAQAAQVGRLTAELEAAEKSQEQFDQAIEGVADAMAGALLAGESLRDGLAQVFKQIAADIIASNIKGALMGQFGGGFNPLAFVGNLFGGNTVVGNDALSGSLRGISGFRAGGGSVSAGRAYVVGENEPELFVPNVSGTVLNGAQVQRAMGQSGGWSVALTIDLRGTTGDRELDAKIQRAGQQVLSKVPGMMADIQKRRQ